MENDFDGFAELESTILDILARTKPTRRERVLGDIGRVLRRSQAARIKAQKQPDGEKFPPRKKKLPMRKRLSATRFLYPMHGSGAPRVVFMKSWAFVGKKYIVGFDIEEGATRTFRRDRIIRFLGVDDHEQNKSAGQWYTPGVKEQAMFKRIRLPKWLKTWAATDAVNAGFRGDVVRIAESHQKGEDWHPKRELIGLSPEDIRMIEDKIDDLVGSGG